MPDLRDRVLAGLCVVAALCLAMGAHAASPVGGDPTYRALRYNDDVSYLADPARAADPWDILKHIPLGNDRHGPVWLGLGGNSGNASSPT